MVVRLNLGTGAAAVPRVLQLLLNTSMVDVIKEVHAQVLTGHPGIEQTRALVRNSFTWRSITKDII